MSGTFLLFGMIGVLGAWGAYLKDTDIQRNGAEAVGYLIKKETVTATDGSDFTVDYWFQLPNGERVDAHRGIPKQVWEALREGETFTVQYSSSDPSRNFPQGGGVTSMGVTLFVSVLAAALLLMGTLLLVGTLRRPRTA